MFFVPANTFLPDVGRIDGEDIISVLMVRNKPRKGEDYIRSTMLEPRDEPWFLDPQLLHIFHQMVLWFPHLGS